MAELQSGEIAFQLAPPKHGRGNLLLSRRSFSKSILTTPLILRAQQSASLKARVKIDTERTIGDIDPKLYGNFIEHLGRCIYGGVFDENSSLSRSECDRIRNFEAPPIKLSAETLPPIEAEQSAARTVRRSPTNRPNRLRCRTSTTSRNGNGRLNLLGLLIMAASVPSFGQWINYPTAGVPKKADGTPNLNAPTPRLPDGKPDFSGIWHAATINKCNPATGDFCGIEIGGSPLALNLGKDMPGGLPYQPWAAELVKKRFSKDDPHVRCLPDNPPRTWVMPHLTKIVHTPQLLVMLYEVNAMYRQIFIDGRPLPEDPNPSWNGYSAAKWDGDTLVIQTTGFRDDLWIDMAGSPITSTGKMTERLRRPTWGTLEVEITVDDPKVYTHPWTASLKEARELNIELIDEVCLENEKSWQHMQTTQPAKQDYKQ